MVFLLTEQSQTSPNFNNTIPVIKI